MGLLIVQLRGRAFHACGDASAGRLNAGGAGGAITTDLDRSPPTWLHGKAELKARGRRLQVRQNRDVNIDDGCRRLRRHAR